MSVEGCINVARGMAPCAGASAQIERLEADLSALAAERDELKRLVDVARAFGAIMRRDSTDEELRDTEQRLAETLAAYDQPSSVPTAPCEHIWSKMLDGVVRCAKCDAPQKR